MGNLLVMQDIVGGYGDSNILHGISLTIAEREIIVIIGPNGAGKSTAMKAVFGLLTIRSGKIVMENEDITGWLANRIVKQGICYVPQVKNVFADLTVQENFEMGAFLRKGDFSASLDRVYEMFPDMKTKRRALAGSLSGGQRQMVAMGRALMLDPKILLLDEPTAGLSPKYMAQIFQICEDIRKAGVSILLVEQHARQALAFADRAYVLANGTNRHEATGAAMLADQAISQMFLGG